MYTFRTTQFKQPTTTAAPPAAAAASVHPRNNIIYWGFPCWYFFHAMAETVREDRFVEVRSDILQIISLMCLDLPCPDCASHATKYLAAHQGFRDVRTKNELRLALCAFHNSVNQRKGLPLFNPADLAATYGRADVSAAAARALFFFQSRHSQPPGVLVPHTLSRDRTAAMVRAWITANADKLFAVVVIPTTTTPEENSMLGSNL